MDMLLLKEMVSNDNRLGIPFSVKNASRSCPNGPVGNICKSNKNSWLTASNRNEWITLKL